MRQTCVFRFKKELQNICLSTLRLKVLHTAMLVLSMYQQTKPDIKVTSSDDLGNKHLIRKLARFENVHSVREYTYRSCRSLGVNRSTGCYAGYQILFSLGGTSQRGNTAT